MTTLTSGEIAIPVTLSNRPTPELFEIDTGNGYTAITWETAEELKVKTKYTPYGGAYVNNVAIDQYAKLDSIGVGRLQSDGKWVALVVRNEMVPPTIAGLVGTDILKNYDVEFDFYNGKVNFFGHNKCPSAVYWTKGNFADVPMKLDAGWHIVVDAALDGKPVTVVLDTGSPTSIMSLDAARKLFGWSNDDSRLKLSRTIPINGGAPTPIYAFPFASLTFEGISVSNPKIELIPKANFDPHGRDDAEIVLGMSVLRQLHLYVAYDEGKLYLSGAEAH